MNDNLGTDFTAVDDLDANLSSVDGGGNALLQNVYRRLVTSRGSLWYDTNYGTNVLNFIEDAGLSDENKAGIIRDEVLKDERVSDAVVTLSLVAGVQYFGIEVRTDDGQAFALTLQLTPENTLTVITQNE